MPVTHGFDQLMRLCLGCFVDVYLFYPGQKGTPCPPSWIWRWPRPSRSSLPGLFRRSSTMSSARRTRRRWWDISRRLGRRRLPLHGWAQPSPTELHSPAPPLFVKIQFIRFIVSTQFITFNISVQLEESNITLTKDVENLSKEKADLNEKFHTQEEGTSRLLTMDGTCLIWHFVQKWTLHSCLF